ncbi:RNA-editing ligase 1, mitochondrial [Acrasis kona]|uniref:RNA-editing ligase 1, mitochondrial n=1 Tax=Acrasis kona TaxID=1008807 RepID=A0AAW2ZQ59_9EUKA
MSDFVGYVSIKPACQKHGKKVQKDKGFNSVKEWIVFEKVHGSNFSFIVKEQDGTKIVKCARRTAEITDPKSYFPEAVKTVREKYNKCAENLYDSVVDLFKNSDFGAVAKVTIYGELFGGRYPHPEVENVALQKPIFTEVSYTPNFDFYGFDVLVTFSDNRTTWLTPDELLQEFPKAGFIIHAKPLFRGTFEEALGYNTEFGSTLPSLFYNLPPLTEKHLESDPVVNIVEGVVIKPNTNFHIRQERIIIKKKNLKFTEKKEFVEKTRNINDGLDSDESREAWKNIETFVTVNRLKNAKSKVGEELVGKQLSEVVVLFSQDVIKDYWEDHKQEWDKLKLSDQDLLMKKLRRQTFEMIREL